MENGGVMLVHNVFFSLNDRSEEAKKRLIDECYHYLSPLPGIRYFHSGTLAEENKRPVNDRDFDVGLHVLFENQESHDSYQASPSHDEFVKRNSNNWERARVFDTTTEDRKS
jgi:hypothetical protein